MSYSASVIVSDDTEVFIVLLCNNYMHKYGVKHVLNDTVRDIYSAVAALRNADVTCLDVGAANSMAGCDFAPSHYGIRHEDFYRSAFYILYYAEYDERRASRR